MSCCSSTARRSRIIDALATAWRPLSIGTKASFAVLSKGASRRRWSSRWSARRRRPRAEVTLDGRSPFSGAKVAELSPRLAQRLGMRTRPRRASAVVDIERDSPAAEFGFQPGDIVREVNGDEIDTAADAERGQPQQRYALVALHRRARRADHAPGVALLTARPSSRHAQPVRGRRSVDRRRRRRPLADRLRPKNAWRGRRPGASDRPGRRADAA